MDFKEEIASPWTGFFKCVVAIPVVLGFFWLAGMTTPSADPKAPDPDREFAAEFAAMQKRIGTPTAVDWRAEWARQTEAALARDRELEAEAQSLESAMLGHFKVKGGSDREAVRRDLAGLARHLVYGAERRRARWLPLGRGKAPAFLAAIAFEESSWHWRRASLIGLRGERCMFQVGPSAARWAGSSAEQIARSPDACMDAALNTMRICAERCGEPAERWLGCYATGECGGAPGVVETRFVLARGLLARMEDGR
jgi:hypothetical protein